MAKTLFVQIRDTAKTLAREAGKIEGALDGCKKMLTDAQAEVQYQGGVIRDLNSEKDGLKAHNEMLQRKVARLEVELESLKEGGKWRGSSWEEGGSK